MQMTVARGLLLEFTSQSFSERTVIASRRFPHVQNTSVAVVDIDTSLAGIRPELSAGPTLARWSGPDYKSTTYDLRLGGDVDPDLQDTPPCGASRLKQ